MPTSSVDDTQVVDRIMTKRRSIRAFLPTQIDESIIDSILTVASRAPSGTNSQPWRVHLLTGETLCRLSQAVCKAFDTSDGSHQAEYNYYPSEFFEPYLSRRRNVGLQLYSLLEISKGDQAKMKQQHRKNFEFFGAPVGLIFTIDRRLAQGSWLDYGMFLQNVILAAEARGLTTCAQGAWIDYHKIITDILQLSPNEQVVCGMALGYEDLDAPENSLISERESLENFVVKHR